MNMMGGSLKSDGGSFGAMADLWLSKRGNFYKLTLPTPLYTLLFHISLYLTIGEYQSLISESRLFVLISYLV